MRGCQILCKVPREIFPKVSLRWHWHWYATISFTIIATQCAEWNLNKVAKTINKMLAELQCMLQSFRVYLIRNPRLNAIESINQQPYWFYQHGQNRLNCLDGEFYALQSRISYKISFWAPEACTLICETFVDDFCNFFLNSLSALWAES